MSKFRDQSDDIKAVKYDRFMKRVAAKELREIVLLIGEKIDQGVIDMTYNELSTLYYDPIKNEHSIIALKIRYNIL